MGIELLDRLSIRTEQKEQRTETERMGQPATSQISESAPLSQIFDEAWDIFTVDTMDQKTIDTVLKNSAPPQNAEHIPTLAGIKKAAQEFCDGNGLELFKAVQLLEGK